MGANVIVIDNDKGIRRLLTYNLQGRGYQVFSYDYSSTNLAALKQYHPDLIILDFNIRDHGTGWALLQILKMDDATAKVPVLIISTTVHLPTELAGYLLTRHIHIVKKPFDLDTLLPLIQQILTLASQAGDIFASDRSLPILVVEDSEDLREEVTTVLGMEGYRFVTADNGLLALDAVSIAEFCLILLDLRMPIMDGFEFLEAYDRQLRPHIPVVILSGEKDILTRVLPSFVIDVLPKPFEINRLLSVVEKYAQPA